MSFASIESLSPADLVAQYILTKRGRGICLSVSDYECVEKWLELAGGEADPVLLILADLFRPGGSAKIKQLSLRTLDKQVSGLLKERSGG